MKSKKHEKHKKHKKEKKKKREKEKSSSSDSDSQGEEMEWTEASTSSSSAKHAREDWMQDESFVPTYSKTESQTKKRKQEKAQEALFRDKKILEERELNPYLKKGTSSSTDSAEAQSSDRPLPSRSFGDGGYNWLKRAHERVKEQAEQEGRTMEEVAVERWGSLEKLEFMLQEAESKMMETQSKYSRNRQPSHKSHDSYKSRGYDTEDRSRGDHDRLQQLDCKKIRSEYDDRRASHDSSRRESSVDDRQPCWKREKYYDKAKEQQYHWRSREEHRGSRDSYMMEHSTSDITNTNSARKSKFLPPCDDATEEGRQHRPSNHPAWKKQSPVKEVTLKDKFQCSEDSREELDFASSRNKDLAVKADKSCIREDTTKKEVQGARLSSTSSSGESNDDTDDEKAKPAEEPILNTNELNYLAARALRANIYKDFDLAAKIERDLEAAKKLRQEYEESGGEIYDGEPREDVMKLKIDCYSLPKALRLQGHTKGKGQEKTIFVGPLRTKHYDDPKMSLQHLFEREKQTTVDDQLMMYIDAASSRKTLMDEENDEDVSNKTAERMNKYPKQEKDAQKAIQDYKRFSVALDKCRLCLDKPGLLKHTIIGKGSEVFLCSPPYKSLVEGHCFIVPVTHVSSTLLLDENEYQEIQVFKRGLMKMFGDKGHCMIFLETSVKHRLFPHAHIECIPMPKDTGELAPLYFKKAIDESEYEWSHNKKLIDFSKKGIRHSVPKGLPFFSVAFGNDGGFAHIVEDDRNFPMYFGKEIIGGMLEIDSHEIVKERKESTDEICTKVLKLVNMWWRYKDYFKY